MVSMKLTILVGLSCTADVAYGAQDDILFRFVPRADTRSSIASQSVTYTAYKGNGTVAAGWPDQSEWMNFDDLWTLNNNTLIQKACDNSPDETSDLHHAIGDVSKSTGVDPRFVLAVIMEESKGCVRVQTTSLSVSNPGVMQSCQGKGTCAGASTFSKEMIKLMVTDGTATNAAGVDLKDLIVKSGATDVSKYYIAARMYNSGPNSIGEDRDLSAPGANACYAADIANRLKGFVGNSCGAAT